MLLLIGQVLLSVAIIAAILLQMQGNGLAQAFGGDGQFYRSKRSVEKLLFRATIVLVALFALVSIVALLLGKK